MTKYDAIIVGSGQAANPLARKLAAAGWRTALIERKWVAGTCINIGCTPTKTLIASGRVAYLVKRSADFGISSSGFAVDVESFIRRKNALVLAYREASTKSLLATEHLDLIFGTAAFSGPREITVIKEDGSPETMTADRIFLDTGASPWIPPIPGLSDINYLDSTTILDLMEIPSHLVIIGGSYIALEFGQLYRRLGSEVTILESSEHFLSKEDDDIASEIKKILEEDGIHILTGTAVRQVAGADRSIRLDLQVSPANAETSSLTASHVLVATGRRAGTAGLNLAAAGIDLDKHGFIAVNDRLETSSSGVYAMGDVKGGPQFTHISYNDHLIVYKNLFENAGLSINGRIAVYCLFTDPELGRVGLTEKEAREQGLNIKVATMPASLIARARENAEDRGLLKVIVNADDRRILGAAMLTVGGGELMSVVQMAMMGGVTHDKIRDAVFAHPTFAESLNNLFRKVVKGRPGNRPSTVMMIIVKNIGRSFGTHKAVDDISFSVEEGENVVFLGTSGCGKTYLLKMINRLIEPDYGEIWIEGRKIGDQRPEDLRKKIGYVFQNIGLFPHYTIAENIGVVPRLMGWDKGKTSARVQALMEKLSLPPAQYQSAYPHELSGGQQQRVGIARALAAYPPVLLMDEPFGALDPITRASVRKDFKELDELRSTTIVLVTHDVQEAFELADRIFLLDKGRIVQQGTPDQLLFQPDGEYARNFFEEQRFQLEAGRIGASDYPALIRAFDHFKNRQS